MWWKAYFWIVLVLTVLGTIWLYGNLEVWTVADWLEIITSAIGLLGLFAFVYKKEILSTSFWKVFFWIVIGSWILSVVHTFTPLQEMLPVPEWLTSRFITSQADILVDILIASPMAYALYRLGYNKSKKTK